MITIQKIGKLLMMLLIVAGLASCNDDNDTEPFEVFGETVTLKKMVNDTVNYAVAYYAFGNYPMTSAKMKFPSGDSISLTDTETSKQTFYKEPDPTDYSKNTPTEGTYTFTVVNEGITHTATDELEIQDFDIPDITEVTPGTSNASLTVKWDKITNADGYVVRLKNDEDETIFVSTLLPSTSSNYIISSSTGFSKQFESGKTYTVELQALLFEDTATASDYWHNIEMISIASQDLVWE